MRFYENSNYAEDPGAIITLDIMNDDDRDRIVKLCDAMSNPVRLDILRHIQADPHIFSVSSMVKALGIPATTLLFHLKKLQAAGILNIMYKTTGRGTQRFVTRNLHGANLTLYHHTQPGKRTSYADMYSLGVGQFFEFVGDTFSFCTDKHGFHSPNSNEFCYIPERFDAQIVYTSKGRISYRFCNLPAKQHDVTELALSLEICSEAPYFDNKYKSDITFWINGKEVAMHTCPGDFGDRRGRLNPDWWGSNNTQYGQLVTVSVNKKGVSVNGALTASSVTIKDLNLSKTNYTEITFGNKDTALNPGGFNIFGRSFGDHPQDICLTYYYEK